MIFWHLGSNLCKWWLIQSWCHPSAFCVPSHELQLPRSHFVFMNSTTHKESHERKTGRPLICSYRTSWNWQDLDSPLSCTTHKCVSILLSAKKSNHGCNSAQYLFQNNHPVSPQVGRASSQRYGNTLVLVWRMVKISIPVTEMASETSDE